MYKLTEHSGTDPSQDLASPFNNLITFRWSLSSVDLFVHRPRHNADHEDKTQGTSIFRKFAVDRLLHSTFCRVAVLGQQGPPLKIFRGRFYGCLYECS